jgi:putative drug exporter of the RND superfamily
MDRVAALLVRRWWAVLLGWVLLVGVLLSAAPPFGDVAIFDNSAYLPPGSAAQRGQDLLEEGWPADAFTRSVTIAFVRADAPLGPEDEALVRAVVELPRNGALAPRFGEVLTHLERPELTEALTSDDGHAWIVQATLEVAPFSPEGTAALRALREQVHAVPGPDGVERFVTGGAAVAIDEEEAIEASIDRTTGLTLVLVIGLLLYIFRSPVAMLVPLLTVGTAYVTALAVVSLLATGPLEVSHLFQTFAIVIVFGAGTDYSLLMMTRFAEDIGEADVERVAPERRRATLVATLVVLAGALASAAGSTIVGFSAQSVARFGLFRTMGPALAIAVAITLLAGLTLTPALMQLAGRWLFWPRRYQRPPASVVETSGDAPPASDEPDERAADDRPAVPS